jgi:SAM-dependent methyltransferase
MTKDVKTAVAANLEIWDSVVEVHAASELYGLDRFLAGDTTLGEVEVREVGDVAGKRLLHPLCHFGLDSLSWARLGAEVTGFDISPKAIATARDLARRSALAANFIIGDVAELRAAVEGEFDIVFMSWGAICWVADLDRLAGDVAALLKPNGFFYLLDAHPLTNAIDDSWTPDEGPPRFPEPYASSAAPVAWEWNDYADPTHDAEGKQSYEWPHSNAQVATALAEAGLRIDFIHDHDFLVWQAAPGLVEDARGHFRWPPGVASLPLSYSIKASKT